MITPGRKLPIVTIALGVLIPVLIVLASIFIFFPFEFVFPSLTDSQPLPASVLTPKTVLSAKSVYNGQLVTVRGKLNYDPVVCQKTQCSDQDKCCGCPDSRTISLSEPSGLSGGSAAFPLVDSDNNPFCVRKEGSCEYDCQDWQEGLVYDITGTFYAQTPPPGWKISLDYYFIVSGKQVAVGSSGQLKNQVGGIMGHVKQLIKSFSTDGTYVLP